MVGLWKNRKATEEAMPAEARKMASAFKEGALRRPMKPLLALRAKPRAESTAVKMFLLTTFSLASSDSNK